MWPTLASLYQRMAAKRMFSRWSHDYEQEVAENAYSAADEVARAAIPHLAASRMSNPLIADIGIGTGLLAQQIFDSMPCRIAGLDFSEDMMASCAGRGITELLIKCDVGTAPWPLEKNAYDMAVSAGLCEYLTPPMLRHFLNESHKVLKKGGAMIFTYLPLKQGDKAIKLWRGHSGTYLVCAVDPADMEDFLKVSGFSLLEHSAPFKGCVFHDGSSYDYRLIKALKN